MYGEWMVRFDSTVVVHVTVVGGVARMLVLTLVSVVVTVTMLGGAGVP